MHLDTKTSRWSFFPEDLVLSLSTFHRHPTVRSKGKPDIETVTTSERMQIVDDVLEAPGVRLHRGGPRAVCWFKLMGT